MTKADPMRGRRARFCLIRVWGAPSGDAMAIGLSRAQRGSLGMLDGETAALGILESDGEPEPFPLAYPDQEWRTVVKLLHRGAKGIWWRSRSDGRTYLGAEDEAEARRLASGGGADPEGNGAERTKGENK